MTSGARIQLPSYFDLGRYATIVKVLKDGSAKIKVPNKWMAVTIPASALARCSVV